MTFTGSSAGSDTFKDTSALFNHDTVAGFGDNGDVIDLTDMNSANLNPGLVAVGGQLHRHADRQRRRSTQPRLSWSDCSARVGDAFHSGADLAGTGTAITFHDPLAAPPRMSLRLETKR